MPAFTKALALGCISAVTVASSLISLNVLARCHCCVSRTYHRQSRASAASHVSQRLLRPSPQVITARVGADRTFALAGYSFGSAVVYEMAAELQRRGQAPPTAIVLLDGSPR